MTKLTEVYRGFKLTAWREEALGGWDQAFFHAFRESDGYCLEDTFTTGVDTPAELIKCLKDRVDDFYENPQDYEEEESVQ